jgi:PAS domain S-box-containing protein
MPSPRESFEGLPEAVPDALVGVGKSGDIRFVNRQTESMFGYQRDELVGVPLETLVPESLREIHVAHRQSYAADPKTRPMGTRVELSGRRRDGTEFPVDISLTRGEPGGDALVIATVRDMTRREAASKDRERLNRLSAVVEFSGEAIISSSLESIIMSWNPAAERLYGYSGEEIVGKHTGVLVPADRTDELEAILDKVRTGNTIENYETDRVRKDGTTFWASITLSPIRDHDGAVTGVSVISRDVTEQRKAVEVAQSMAAIVESSRDAIIAKSFDGDITSWNPAAERMFGWTSEEVIGKPGTVLAPADRIDEIQTILAKIRDGQPVQMLETERVRKDGTVFPVSIAASAVRSADGTVSGAAAIIRDLTQLREASELSTSMIEASLDSMVSISPEGMITNANEATAKLTGVPRDQLIGTSFSDYFTEPDRAEAINQKVFENGFVTDYPLILHRHDGQEAETEVVFNASVYRDAVGDVIGVFAAGRDETELKQAAEYARGLIEAALDPMVTISPEGKITDTNEATAKLTGVPREKLIGTPFSSYFTDPEKADAGYQKVLEEGFVADIPLTVRPHGSQETPIEVLYNASVYRDAGGNVRGVFASARDVTKLILAQREVAHQQAMELDKLAELERFQRLTVGRELRMIELKKEIEYLKKFGPAGGGESGGQR